MPLQLISRNYGPTYAGSKALIRTTDVASPARLYARPNGGLLSANGTATLDSTGSFSVYADDRNTYQVTLLNSFDQPVGVEHSVDGGQAETDPVLSSVTYSNGRVTSIRTPSALTTYTYDAFGRIATVIRNGVSRTVSYNPDGSIASIA